MFSDLGTDLFESFRSDERKKAKVELGALKLALDVAKIAIVRLKSDSILSGLWRLDKDFADRSDHEVSSAAAKKSFVKEPFSTILGVARWGGPGAVFDNVDSKDTLFRLSCGHAATRWRQDGGKENQDELA